MNIILKIFTIFQEKLMSYLSIGIDVQKIQTVILVILTTAHGAYAAIALISLNFKDFFMSGSLAVVLLYYAMSLNEVIQESSNE